MPNDDLITALFTAFATFTAFGAAIAGFVAAGGVVQTVASWWTQHGKAEAEKDMPASGLRKALKAARRRTPLTISVVSALIVVVVVISGVGLLLSSILLDDYAHDRMAHLGGVYPAVIGLFWAEVLLLTLATVAAVGAAAGTSIAGARSADKASEIAKTSSELDAALREAAIDCLGSRPIVPNGPGQPAAGSAGD
jgi:hypothetical protein